MSENTTRCLCVAQLWQHTFPGQQQQARWRHPTALINLSYDMQALRDVHRTRSHRDLKLANVMVSGWDRDGGVQIKLIDWGSSRRHEGIQRDSTPNNGNPKPCLAHTSSAMRLSQGRNLIAADYMPFLCCI